MDVYISSEAGESLKALALSGTLSEGMLVGHKRGHDFIIEQVFSYPNALSMTDKKFAQINQHFDQRVIGFYTYSTEQKEESKISVPFAVGKIFLRVKTNKAKGLFLDPYFIDYDQTFCLKKIGIHALNRDAKK
ncbi:MAG: hypothetical protein GF421_02205 [Candidatus Aminicenantes bacterium]|nr:hypothetical protein [Candidatus Aminicenantes bacterium]